MVPFFPRQFMSISDHDIDKLCALSQLGLAPHERDEARRDLERMIEMVGAIASVATEGVEPLLHPLDATARLRADVVTETVDRDSFQHIAPLTRDGLYLVPRVLE